MAQTTFYDLWMSMRLYVPGAPTFLLQKWMKDTFRDLADRRIWSWQMIQGQLVWNDSRTIDPVVGVFGSPTITGVAADFVASDLNRNLRIGTYPIYTIISVAADGSYVTLDRNYEGPGEGADLSAEILDAYAVMPAHFETFIAIVDPVNQRQVPWWATWDEMNLIDPLRMAAASVPRLLASASPSVYPPTLGQAQYEYYPKPSEHGALQYYAKSAPFLMRDSDPLPGLLQHRQDVIEAGILAKAARWPGTIDQKNPYFNLQLAMAQQAEFDRLANQLDIRDDDLYQQSLQKIPYERINMLTWAFDTHLLQQTDASLSSYAGSGYGTGWGGY